MFFTSLLSTVFLALAVSANPVVTIRNAPLTLQLSRSLNMTNIGNLYQNDFNRAQALRAHGTEGVANSFASTPVINRGTEYTARVGVGNPPTLYDLAVDTGSAHTWVGAGKRYVKTRSSTATGRKVTAKYLVGGFSGTLYFDTITLASGFAVQRQGISVALTSQGSKGVDGVLGLGPAHLTFGTLNPGRSDTIPTVTDDLFAAHMIPENMVAISFQPLTGKSTFDGQLTWGAVDRSKFWGTITYVPITTVAPAKNFWGIMQTITYGRTPILSNAVGLMDTGTSLLAIASDAFARYKAATGATGPDPVTKLLNITPAGFARMQSLFFKIGPTTFEFTANAQIWPRNLNTHIGGSRGKVYIIVADLGHKSGQGFDFINGQVWHQRFYSVYDTTNKRVGIANSPYVYAKTN